MREAKPCALAAGHEDRSDFASGERRRRGDVPVLRGGCSLLFDLRQAHGRGRLGFGGQRGPIDGMLLAANQIVQLSKINMANIFAQFAPLAVVQFVPKRQQVLLLNGRENLFEGLFHGSSN